MLSVGIRVRVGCCRDLQHPPESRLSSDSPRTDVVTVEQACERRRIPEHWFKWAGQIFYFNSKAGRPVVKPGWAAHGPVRPGWVAHGPALSAEPARYCENKATERGRLRSSRRGGATARLAELFQRVVGDVYLLEHAPITSALILSHRSHLIRSATFVI